ncbi:MAG: cytochrome c biogenesis protein CcdA [Candidatus Omnitrophota bacterium]
MFENLLIALETIFKSSPIIGLGVSFLAGILSSFSPCIYPLIPVTLAVIGASSAAAKFRGFSISLTFVLGISVTYTFLGIVSSYFGILLGTFRVNPLTYLILGFVFLFLGALEFGILKLNIPFSLNYNPGPKKGLISIFILGIISGFAMIPCSFPVLSGILTLITLRKSVFYGASALFIFSLGYGMILLVLGTFASLIKKIPKQGVWALIVKKGLGLSFVIIGLYFLSKSFRMIL